MRGVRKALRCTGVLMTGDRFCGHCGNKLERVGYRARERRYARAMFCDRACSGKSIRGEAHYAWKGHERTPGTARCWPTTTEDVQP